MCELTNVFKLIPAGSHLSEGEKGGRGRGEKEEDARKETREIHLEEDAE